MVPSVAHPENVDELINAGLVHSVHTSERRSYRGCRRRWSWIFRERYYPLVTPKPLEFGVAFHAAMEKFYSPETWHDKETAAALAQAAFVQTCKEQYQNYLKLNKGNIDPAAKEDYDNRIKLGLGMIRYYTKWVSPFEDTNFKPIKVEIEFEVPIRDPNGDYVWCKCSQCWQRFANWFLANKPSGYPADWVEGIRPTLEETIDWDYETYRLWQGLPVTYGGRIDMVAEDELGRYWIFDWKTAAQLSDSTGDHLLLDDQITSYCWALWSIGIPVVGFVYAEIKKAIPEEPEPNKTQRLGRWYSVNKQMNTTYEMYYQTVAENDPQALAAGAYDDFLEYLKSPDGPKYHARHQIFRSDTELSNAGYNIWQEATEMISPDLAIYPAPGRFSCSFCAFQDPCLAKNRGEDYQYALDTMFEKRARAYYEREPSTDTKGGQ